VNNIRTVSDTKRDFYTNYTRPINSIYRRVVEELIVEMHLLSVNANFKPDPVYYTGVCQSFDQFMQGYQPESDREAIFKTLCQSVGGNPDEYRHQAQVLMSFAENKSPEEMVKWLADPNGDDGVQDIVNSWQQIINQDQFKYSRLFAIGLYTIIGKDEEEIRKDEKKISTLLEPITTKIDLPLEKLKKDWDLYASNLEKMTQRLADIQDMIEAERKKRLEKQEQKD